MYIWNKLRYPKYFTSNIFIFQISYNGRNQFKFHCNMVSHQSAINPKKSIADKKIKSLYRFVFQLQISNALVETLLILHYTHNETNEETNWHWNCTHTYNIQHYTHAYTFCHTHKHTPNLNTYSHHRISKHTYIHTYRNVDIVVHLWFKINLNTIANGMA